MAISPVDRDIHLLLRNAAFTLCPAAQKYLSKAIGRTARTLTMRRLPNLADGGNAAVLCGYDRLYLLDLDRDAQFGYSRPELAGTLTFWRENDLSRAKFLFRCPTPQRSFIHWSAGFEVRGMRSFHCGGYHCGIVAGTHDPTGAEIRTMGDRIVEIDTATVAEWVYELLGRKYPIPPTAYLPETDGDYHLRQPFGDVPQGA